MNAPTPLQSKYISLVRLLLERTVGKTDTKQMEIWQKWVELNAKDNRIDTLRRLIEEPGIAATFQAIALTGALCILPEHLPFAWWNGHVHLLSHPLENIRINSLSPPLQKLAAQLICANADYLEKEIQEEDANRASSLGSHIYEFVSGCNQAIIRLLSGPETNDKDTKLLLDQLFDRFSLRVPGSGYKPFLDFMSNESVDSYWKRLMNRRMCAIIEEEETGPRQPNRSREHALPSFIATLEEVAGCEVHVNVAEPILPYRGLPYSPVLFLEQMDFILGLGLKDALHNPIFDDSSFVKLSEHLIDEQFPNVFLKFVRHVTLTPRQIAEPFRIDSASKLKTCLAALQLCPEDGELASHLERLIAEHHERENKNKQEVAHREEMGRTLLAMMKEN